MRRPSTPTTSRIEIVSLGAFAFPTRGIAIDDFGTRDSEEPDTNRELVVCLGCSHTYGYTRGSNTYAKELERLLNHRFQVLNMGRRNYGLRLCIDWYHHFAKKLSPSWCVIQLPLFCRQPIPELQPERPETYTMDYGAYRYLRGFAENRFWDNANLLIAQDVDRLRLFLNELIANEVKPIVVGYRTHKEALPLLTEAQRIHYGQVAELCSELHTPFLHGDEVSNTAFKQRGHLFDKRHPNEAGNRWLAYQIGQFIDPGLKTTKRTEVRNLAVDARGILTRIPRRVYRGLAWRLKSKHRGKESAIPTDSYTLF